VLRKLPSWVILSAVLVLGTAHLHAQSTKQGKFNIARGGVLNVFDNAGSVMVHAATGQQLIVSSTPHSPKVEVDSNSTPDGRRVEIRAHALPQQKPSNDEARVDIDIALPPGVALFIDTATAPITVDNVSGDLTLSSDTGQVTLRNIANAHVRVKSIASPVSLSNVTGGFVEITSSSGAVQLTTVSGNKVTVNTGSGNISYQGDFSGSGDYMMITHTGAIDVLLPPTASIDLTARSLTGSVENDFPLQAKQHTSFVPDNGRSFAGTSNSGSSSVELESFSGRIRVKKQ
jgi:DUF4097 and DUF4098 domain-containing protein YvlB